MRRRGRRTRIRTMCARTPLSSVSAVFEDAFLPPFLQTASYPADMSNSDVSLAKIVFRTHSFPNINFHSSFPGVFFPTFCQNGARRRASTICVRVRESIFYLDENIFKPLSLSYRSQEDNAGRQAQEAASHFYTYLYANGACMGWRVSHRLKLLLLSPFPCRPLCQD